MKNIIKIYTPYIILTFSIILLIVSSIFLYNTWNTNISIKSDSLTNASKVNLERYKKDKNLFKDQKYLDIWNLTEKSKNITIANLLNKTQNTKVTIYSECLAKNKKWTEEYKKCIGKFYFHKYARLLNWKWIIDKRICSDVENIFWKDSYLYNRCNFIYEVNKWTKFLNISWCKNLPEKNKFWFNKQKCENNIIYTSFWNDNTIWKYLETVKNRKEWSKSALYTDILNKNWTILNWEVQWTDFFEFDLKKYLKSEYTDFKNNNITN